MYVGDLFHLFCKVMAVILFYQKKFVAPMNKWGVLPQSPLASGEVCPHPLKGSYSMTLIES